MEGKANALTHKPCSVPESSPRQHVDQGSKCDALGRGTNLLYTYIKSLLLVLLKEDKSYMHLYTCIYIYFSKNQGKKNTDQETETIQLDARGCYSGYELAHLFASKL